MYDMNNVPEHPDITRARLTGYPHGHFEPLDCDGGGDWDTAIPALHHRCGKCRCCPDHCLCTQQLLDWTEDSTCVDPLHG